MSSRIAAHKIETASRDYLRMAINSFEKNGRTALVRECTERDYGIDFLVELFENGDPTGNIAFLQLKATAKPIVKNEKATVVSCPAISASSLKYASQNKVPYFVLYVSVTEPKGFYFVELQSLKWKELMLKAERNKGRSTVIKMPIGNHCIANDIGLFFDDMLRCFEKAGN